LTEQIDPANSAKKRITTYYYDANGLNLTSSVTTGSGNSIQTDYTYDSLGRKKTATLWRRTSATDATLIPLTTTYDYDALDRVIKVTDTLGNYVETTYDGNGKCTR
jgi:YD repeat-containing protein